MKIVVIAAAAAACVALTSSLASARDGSEPTLLGRAILPADAYQPGPPSGSAIGPGRGPYADKVVRGGVMYGAGKAALERFTQGLAQEVAQHGGIAVSCVSPSRTVPTPGTVYHKLMASLDDPRGEPPMMMARAVLLLASEPAEKVNGRVTYSQQILKEWGWIEKGAGRGIDTVGTGYSQI